MSEVLAMFLSGAFDNPEQWLVPIVVITLAFSIPIVAIVTEHFQKREKMRVIAKALEQGVPVENLGLDASEESQSRRLPYRSGMVSVAVGLGVVMIGLLGFGDDLEDLSGGFGASLFVGGGLLVMFIGVALLINDRMNYKRFLEDKERGR